MSAGHVAHTPRRNHSANEEVLVWMRSTCIVKQQPSLLGTWENRAASAVERSKPFEQRFSVTLSSQPHRDACRRWELNGTEAEEDDVRDLHLSREAPGQGGGYCLRLLGR